MENTNIETTTTTEIKKTYSYEERIELFDNELDFIQSEDVKNLAKDILKNAHNYFFYVPASSTGKYHPEYTTGEHGLALHTKALMCFLKRFVEVECCPLSEREKDLLFVAGLAHDTEKLGNNENGFTVYEHPILAADKIRSYKGSGIILDSELDYIAEAVEAHMGQWNTDRSGNAILPKPTTPAQIYVHMSDYFASRKEITVNFEGYEDSFKNKVVKAKKYEAALNLYNENKSLEEIASELSIDRDSVVDLLIDAYKDNKPVKIEDFVSKEHEEAILKLATSDNWSGYLRDIKDSLPTDVPYCEIRTVLVLHNINKEKDKSKMGLLSNDKYVNMYLDKKSFREIADYYKVKLSTVENAVLESAKTNASINIDSFIDPAYEARILELADEKWDGFLRTIKEVLPENVSYMCIKAVLIKHNKLKK